MSKETLILIGVAFLLWNQAQKTEPKPRSLALDALDTATKAAVEELIRRLVEGNPRSIREAISQLQAKYGTTAGLSS